MLQLSRRFDYAVRIMLELGKLPEGARCHTAAIALEAGVPVAFLHKITADLVKAGLVRTYSGPGGGLTLARPTAEINMLHIVEAIEGPICLNVCLRRPDECPRDSTCPAHPLWARIQASLKQQLRETSLDSLTAKFKTLDLDPAHSSETS